MHAPRRRRNPLLALESLDERVMPSSVGAGLPAVAHAGQVHVNARHAGRLARQQHRAQVRAARAAAARFGGEFRTAVAPSAAPSGVPSGPFFYNTYPGAPSGGAGVIARDTPGGSATTTTNVSPDPNSSAPPTGFYYSSYPDPTTGSTAVIARSSPGFAPVGQEVPGGGGQVFGGETVDPDGPPVAY